MRIFLLAASPFKANNEVDAKHESEEVVKPPPSMFILSFKVAFHSTSTNKD
ncbi:hypothetical protein YC2023_060915 [Brassica napus]